MKVLLTNFDKSNLTLEQFMDAWDDVRGNEYFGRIDHPPAYCSDEEFFSASLNAAFKITNIQLEGNKVYGEVTPLTDFLGSQARDLLLNEPRFSIRSAFDGNNKLHVICWDLLR